MVFDEVVSGVGCWVRGQSGHTVVNKESSLPCMRTSVRSLNVQEVAKVEDISDLLTPPIICLETVSSQYGRLSSQKHKGPHAPVISFKEKADCSVEY